MAAPLIASHRARLAELALKHRLPGMFGGKENVEAGGLMSYSADLNDMTRRAAIYIDKILKGVKPADLPVEQASKYELVINLKTAKALGLDRSDDAARSRRRGDRMIRRQFIRLLSGAAAWPLAARAQQPAIAIIGFLSSRSSGDSEHLVTAFREGLKETGYVEGENAVIAFRWAEGRYDRLPAQAAELARQRVAVIVAAGGNVVAFAAKAATSTIPIVFIVGSDPVEDGLVASLSRSGGHITGVTLFTSELGAKRLGLLRELVPTAAAIAVLLNPTSPAAQKQSRDIEAAARAIGERILLLNAGNDRELNPRLRT